MPKKNLIFPLVQWLKKSDYSSLPFIQLNWATQFSLLLKTCSHGICVHCMLDGFSNWIMFSYLKKLWSNVRWLWVWFLKICLQDTQVNFNKDATILKRAEKINRPSAFYKLDALNIFAKVLGKFLCWSLVSIKLLTSSMKS